MMKKSILDLGKALSKAEQKTISGGDGSLHPDKHTCKVHCRALYGMTGICTPYDEGGPLQWQCFNY